MGNITFKQYRNIDLSIFAVLLAVSEAVTAVATNKWFAAQPIAISTSLLFICIVMMRWGAFAAIHASLGGFVFCLVSGGGPQQFAIYVIGNAFALLGLLWFKFFKKDAIRKDPAKLLLFVVSVYCLMQVGRWLVSMIFGQSPSLILVYLGTDIISLLFAAVVMILLRKSDGMIEDQKVYLFRLKREREAEANFVGGYDNED